MDLASTWHLVSFFNRPVERPTHVTLKVILDVDTGIDDAFALLFAARSPLLNLLGVTCVDGNAKLDYVVRNTLHVLQTAGADEVPVAAGAVQPLMGGELGAEEVHGSDGLAGLSPKVAPRPQDPRHAVELMRDLILENGDDITLVALGPLTNVALLLSTYPNVASKLRQIVIMGGSTIGGNVTAAAEFNVWHDPEAAHVVFQSGVPLTMYGLDVFYGLPLSDQDLEGLSDSQEASARLVLDLFAHYKKITGAEATLGDYGAVASLVYPEWATTRPFYVTVDTSHGPNRGRTTCDARPDMPGYPFEREGQLCNVVMETESRKMVEAWLAVVS
jgi:pyrimidine-specific ribonucleoside hydrolase